MARHCAAWRIDERTHQCPPHRAVGAIAQARRRAAVDFRGSAAPAGRHARHPRPRGDDDPPHRALSQHHPHPGARRARAVALRPGMVRAATRSRREGRVVRLQRRTECDGGDLRRQHRPDLCRSQPGHTQDVSARAWLAAGGLQITLTGGDAQVIPTNNPDQLSLFKLRELDAVWTVEPWVSRLESEAGGKVLVEESQAITTVVASGAKFLKEHRDLARRVVAAHQELTDWIKAHPGEAQKIAHDELLAETRTEIAPALIAHAWARITLTASISREPLEDFVTHAKEVGFLRSIPDLSRLVETP